MYYTAGVSDVIIVIILPHMLRHYITHIYMLHNTIRAFNVGIVFPCVLSGITSTYDTDMI